MAKETREHGHEGGPPAGGSVIGRQTGVEGTVTGAAPVRVEGTFKGSIRLEAPLEVAEGATVEADVHATVVRIAGRVIGDVSAAELVELLATASVTGDVAAPALHVVEGASLDGRVEMQPTLPLGKPDGK